MIIGSQTDNNGIAALSIIKNCNSGLFQNAFHNFFLNIFALKGVNIAQKKLQKTRFFVALFFGSVALF